MTPLNASGIEALAQWIRLNDMGEAHCAKYPWSAAVGVFDDYRGQARVMLTVYEAGSRAAPAQPEQAEDVGGGEEWGLKLGEDDTEYARRRVG